MEDDKASPILARWSHNSYKTKSSASNISYFPSAQRTMIFNGRWFLTTSSVPENITVQLMEDQSRRTGDTQTHKALRDIGFPWEVYASLLAAPWLCLLLPTSGSAEASVLLYSWSWSCNLSSPGPEQSISLQDQTCSNQDRPLCTGGSGGFPSWLSARQA